MAILVDLLVFAAALAAALYCHVLARRVARLADMRGGVGGAIAALSERVDALTRTLDEAAAQADRENAERAALVDRAERAARKLEIMLAALQDVENGADTPGSVKQGQQPARAGRRGDDPRRNEGAAGSGGAVPPAMERARDSGGETGQGKPGSAVAARATGAGARLHQRPAEPAAAGRGSTLRAIRHPSGVSESGAAPAQPAAPGKGGGSGVRLLLRRRVLRSDAGPGAERSPAGDTRPARMEPAE